MRGYVLLAVMLSFAVDLLLMLSANRLAGFPWGFKGCLGAAALGGIYGGVCFLPSFAFLGHPFWRTVMLGLMGMVAFGWQKSGITRTLLFVLLSMSLGGAAVGFRDGSPGPMLLYATLLGIMCLLGIPGGMEKEQYVNVELHHAGRSVQLTALRDTGNMLTDPITGQHVLIADAAAAWELLGLGKSQLRDPIETVKAGSVRGLRLIPYRAVGCAGGMLLGLRVEQMQIGSWKGSGIVAFAPEGLGEEGTYRALTGGAI